MQRPLTDPTGLIVNIIEYDPQLSAGYQPPDGLTMHPEIDGVAIGGTITPDGTYTPPPPPPDPGPSDTDRVQAALELIDQGATTEEIANALTAADHVQLEAARAPIAGGKLGRA